jgi:hypothetical protein
VQQKLIDQVSNYENIFAAYFECARGKKSSRGYMESVFGFNDHLLNINKQLKTGSEYPWKGYREFYVCDPKRRLVMAAPFLDRVVHHAIHRVIEPVIDKLLSTSVYACRERMGNRLCALKLFSFLKKIGSERYVIKLDVRKYFESIDHTILLNKLMAALTDDSLYPLLNSLIKSHKGYSLKNRGIPIGNLTSQLFANFYLREVDIIATSKIGLSYYHKTFGDTLYLRYMDDMVIVAPTKAMACEAAHTVCNLAEQELALDIPFQKRYHLSNDAVPFLGYKINEHEIVPLQRKVKKFNAKLKQLLIDPEIRPSYTAQVQQSFNAWKGIGL